jgi:hypothetical protein
MTPIAYY